MSSSGLVPVPCSNRLMKEYSLSRPEPSRRRPFPPFRPPSQVASEFRMGIDASFSFGNGSNIGHRRGNGVRGQMRDSGCELGFREVKIRKRRGLCDTRLRVRGRESGLEYFLNRKNGASLREGAKRRGGTHGEVGA